MELLTRRHGLATSCAEPTRATPYPLHRFIPLRAAETGRLVSTRARPLGHCDAQPLEVLVYCGEGAGYNSSRNMLAAVQSHLAHDIQARFLTTKELLEGSWQQRCLLLVMPGGADLPYCKHLNGRGNQLIKSFVAAGGSYLGICAGAYYACQRVEFEPGTTLEVVGDRELGFFPGTARGAAYPGFDYLTERGASAAPLRFRESPSRVPRIPTTAAATTNTATRTATTMEAQSAAGVLGGGPEHAVSSVVPRLCRRHLVLAADDAERPGAGRAAVGREVGQPWGALTESEAQAVGGTGAGVNSSGGPQQHVTAAPYTPAGAAGGGAAAASGDGGGIDCADPAGVRQGLLESGAVEGQQEVERRGSGGAGCRTNSSGGSSGDRSGHDVDGDGTHYISGLHGDGERSSSSSNSSSSSSDRNCGGGNLTEVDKHNGGLRRRTRRPGFHLRAYANDDGDGCDGDSDGCDFGGVNNGWVYCKDYSNGGPVFVPSVSPPAAAAEGTVSSLTAEGAVSSLTAEGAVSPLTAEGAVSSLTAEGAVSPLTPSGIDIGGADGGAGSNLAGSLSYETLAVYPGLGNSLSYETLAVYPGLGNSLAAVRCTVGAGVAVLCGTHPEMPHDALLGSALLYDTVQAHHLVALGAELAVWERQRRQFWRVLLLACCTAACQAATAAPPASASRAAVLGSAKGHCERVAAIAGCVGGG